MLNSVKYTNTELGLQTEHYQHFKGQQNGIPTLYIAQFTQNAMFSKSCKLRFSAFRQLIMLICQ
jgi:hypothetical protein